MDQYNKTITNLIYGKEYQLRVSTAKRNKIFTTELPVHAYEQHGNRLERIAIKHFDIKIFNL